MRASRRRGEPKQRRRDRAREAAFIAALFMQSEFARMGLPEKMLLPPEERALGGREYYDDPVDGLIRRSVEVAVKLLDEVAAHISDGGESR